METFDTYSSQVPVKEILEKLSISTSRSYMPTSEICKRLLSLLANQISDVLDAHYGESWFIWYDRKRTLNWLPVNMWDQSINIWTANKDAYIQSLLSPENLKKIVQWQFSKEEKNGITVNEIDNLIVTLDPKTKRPNASD
jgi:hypothetical protein